MRPKASVDSVATAVSWPVWIARFSDFSTGSEAIAPEVFAPLRHRDGAEAPLQITAALFALLASSIPNPRLADLIELIEPNSLLDLAVELLDRYARDGFEESVRWAQRIVRALPDDELVGRLGDITIQVTYRDDLGLEEAIDILADIDSPAALRELRRIRNAFLPQGTRSPASTRADRALAKAAARRSLPTDDIEMCIPSFGLDTRASLRLDFGPRWFLARLIDADVVLEDDSGHRIETLPKPRKSDDPAFSAVATRRFRILRNSSRGVVREVITRLEHAMLSQRTWTSTRWRETYLVHPILAHFARSLVWMIVPPDASTTPTTPSTSTTPSSPTTHTIASMPSASTTTSSATTTPTTTEVLSPSYVAPVTFRAQDDGTLADADDNPFVLPDDAFITVAHPALLTDDLRARWLSHLTDYHVVPPFEQLTRCCFRLGEPLPLRAR